MTTRLYFFLGLLTMLSLTSAPLYAIEMNQRQGLGPTEQVKVGKALVQSYRTPSLPSVSRGASEGCGNTKIGTITGTSRSSRVENIVAVRGDIITVNRNTRCH